MKTYRIKDIARLAGVSTGTVDRILHKRGKVSVEARERVDRVLKETNYQPNLVSRSPALKKEYNFVVLTPHLDQGEYWAKLAAGVDRAQQELAGYHVNVRPLHFNQYDRDSFDGVIPLIELSECQGVVIATLFRDSVLELVARLDSLDIPYVLIDAYIENTRCLAYFGAHSYDSGYMAGRLLFEQIRINDDVALFHFIRRGDYDSVQVTRRREGFCDYFTQHSHQGQIRPLQMHAEDDGYNEIALTSFFEANPQLKAGVLFNSRAAFVCRYLEKAGLANGFRLVGYDVLDGNVACLQRGPVTHLIGQRPEVQGFHAVKALFRHLVINETNELLNYMPIDILVKENIAYYNH